MIVDNHTYRRLVYEVLSETPTREAIRQFLAHFWSLLTKQGLSVKGVTTDGSNLYPEAIREVFGPVDHQVCRFHVVSDLNRALLSALAQMRRELRDALPKVPPKKPQTASERRLVRRKRRLEQRILDLFEHRYLFVKKDLTPAERRTLAEMSRANPTLRVLREILEEVHRLFDRRCRVDTAREKLAKLRRKVGRFRRLRAVFRKLMQPTLEKALTFLDNRLLPSTSNAVERGNRRHRKMQKVVYRVRTKQNLEGRIALDFFRDERQDRWTEAVLTLHDLRQQDRRRRNRDGRSRSHNRTRVA
jgi:hypothetical protein